MKITRAEVEKLLATMYRLKATEVELDVEHFGSAIDASDIDYIGFDIWKDGKYFTTVLTIENEEVTEDD